MLSINTIARVIVNTTVCTGVSLQKSLDRTYDRTATNVTYTLLAATITEQ